MGSSKVNSGNSARQKGERRKRRQHRAWRRDATQQQRERTNAAMRAIGHPGWVQPAPTSDWGGRWWDN